MIEQYYSEIVEYADADTDDDTYAEFLPQDLEYIRQLQSTCRHTGDDNGRGLRA